MNINEEFTLGLGRSLRKQWEIVHEYRCGPLEEAFCPAQECKWFKPRWLVLLELIYREHLEQGEGDGPGRRIIHDPSRGEI